LCRFYFAGDPTTFGNLQPANEILDAMKRVIDEKNFNGYAPSVGFIEAREAVAQYSGGFSSK
jgi:tyrosine aminotransferase